ncbi:MAG: hypothetical protein AAFX05_14495 [Planctomycetota bacterium]
MRRSAFLAHIASRADAELAEARRQSWRALAGLAVSVGLGTLGVASTDAQAIRAGSVGVGEVLVLLASVLTFIGASVSAGLHLYVLMQHEAPLPRGMTNLVEQVGDTGDVRTHPRDQVYPMLLRQEADRGDAAARGNARRRTWLQRGTLSLAATTGLLGILVIGNAIVALGTGP